ncbi:hypothetical protein HRbin33_00028 [bacterium HR33]|nr:hypothetical protein HRbin33_00028 [bacterium HR33]
MAVAGLLISALLLWWVLHDVDPREVLGHAREARWWLFVLSVAVATSVFPIRAHRWRYLLERNGKKVGFAPLWHATAIGFMANNLLPARAGEVARAYAARRLAGVRFSQAVGSLAVERVMDGLVLLALMALAITLGGIGQDTAVAGVSLFRTGVGAALIFVPALGVAFWVVHRPEQSLTLLRRVFARLLPGHLALRAVDVLEGLLMGLESLRSGSRLLVVTLWSVVHWLVGGLAYWLAFEAFGIEVHWTAALLLQSLAAFGVAIPSSPGFFGPFEAVVRATLGIYGVPASQAVSYAVAYHLAAFIPVTLLGFWSLARAHLHLSELRADEARGE